MRAPQIGFDQLVQDFFLRRLINERGASARTVESYRDGFELLFGFIEKRLAKPPSKLTMTDLDAPLILDFLDHLEIDRHNGARTRNARLAAIRSFMRYVALRDPASLAITTRVLAIPAKRFDRPVLGYLTRHEVAAILAAPDRNTWSGQRDAALLAVAYNTGARVSELTGLQVRHVLLDRQSALHLYGKGRKQRVIPLWATTATGLRSWLERIPHGPRHLNIPQQKRDCHDPLRGPRPTQSRRRRRRTRLPVPRRPEHLSPHPSPLDRRPPPRIGHRPSCHRLVARALQSSRYLSIPRSRPRHQRSHPRTLE